MTKRSNRPLRSEQAGRIEEANLQALKRAADAGWSDIEAGLYTDVNDDRLEDFVARLGAREASAKYLAPDASTKSIPSEPSKGIPAKVVSEGRYTDAEDDELEAFVGKIGLPDSATIGTLIGKSSETP